MAPPPSSVAAIESNASTSSRHVKRVETVESGARPASMLPIAALAASIVPASAPLAGLARTTILRSVAGNAAFQAARSMPRGVERHFAQ